MKLIDLVNYFRNGGSLEKFCNERFLDKDSEVVEVYMSKPLTLQNELVFFEIEKTEGKIEYISNGITFFNLFDFYYFFDVIEDLKQNTNSELSNNEVANRLLSYAINDA